MLYNYYFIKLFLFKSIFSYTKEYAKCKIIAIPYKFNFVSYAFAFQKHSPYLPIFNYYLKLLDEQGTLHKLSLKYQSLPQNCHGSGGNPIGNFTKFLLEK